MPATSVKTDPDQFYLHLTGAREEHARLLGDRGSGIVKKPPSQGQGARDTLNVEKGLNRLWS